MKHFKRIKRFNENQEEKRFPKKVSIKEFFEIKEKYKMDDFSTHERKTIIEILERKNLKWNYSMNPEFVEIHFPYSEVEIVKYIDEWFTIITTDRWNQHEYFICDGFEEVESWLNSS